MLCYPDYDKSILSIPASLLRHYGLEPGHKTLPLLDELLDSDPRNVVFMVFDGLGSSILEKHLGEGSFLRANQRGELSSVFPPTTAAATVSLFSGLSPAEHGWLGWSLYFPELDKNVNILPNTLAGTRDTPAADYHMAQRFMPYTTVLERIVQKTDGVVDAQHVSPYSAHRTKSLTELFGTVEAIGRKPGRHLLTAYWPEPDGALHRYGTGDEAVQELAGTIDVLLRELCRNLRDTLVVVTADHGHTDTEYAFTTDCPELVECLARPQSIEARAANFFVKPERRGPFETAFIERFGKEFLLLTKEQVLERGLFGPGVHHPRFAGFLGDYLAIATGKLSLDYARPTYRGIYKSQHAGLTKEELTVPFVAFQTRK